MFPPGTRGWTGPFADRRSERLWRQPYPPYPVYPDHAVQHKEHPVDKGQILLAAEYVATPPGDTEHDRRVLECSVVGYENDGLVRQRCAFVDLVDSVAHLRPGEPHQQRIQKILHPAHKTGIHQRFSFILFLQCGFLFHHLIPKII